MEKFLAKYQVTMTVSQIDKNPNMTDMMDGARHYRCVLRYHGRMLTVLFSQGPAIRHSPEVAGVLDCLASDASGVDATTSFEQWAEDMGYDTDIRKAERTWRAVEKQTAGLRRLLGSDAFDELLEAERF